MPKLLTLKQACKATGLSRYKMLLIIKKFDVGRTIKNDETGYTTYLIEPAKLAKVVPITKKDVERAVAK